MGIAVESLDIIERGSLELHNEDHVRTILSAGPEFEERQYFTVHVKSGRYFINAGKYIGVIPLSPKLVLRVRSKVPTTRLIKILGIARESPILIRLLERQYTPGENLDILELLILALHGNLPPLLQHGPIRQYRRAHAVGQAMRGRPKFEETVTQLWPRANFDRAAYEFYEFSADNYLNRAIEYTLWHVNRVLPQISTTLDGRLLADFSDAHRMFASVQPDRTRAFLPALRRHLQERVTHEPYGSFRSLLSICRMILDDLGVDLDAEATNPVALSPMVIDMETVFQRFLLNIITEQAGEASGLACWDTATEQQVPLLRDPIIPIPNDFLRVTSREFAKPDFTLAVNGVPVLIGDAKYKSHQNVDDVYQAVSHAEAYGVQDVILVYPAADMAGAVTFASLGSVGDVRVFVSAFPLDTDDLENAGQQLFAGICRIIETRHPGSTTVPFSPVGRALPFGFRKTVMSSN